MFAHLSEPAAPAVAELGARLTQLETANATLRTEHAAQRAQLAIQHQIAALEQAGATG